MSKTYTLNIGMVTPGATVTGQSVSVDGAEATIDEAFTANKTNYEYSIAFPYARLKKFVALCSVAAVLEFNDATTGAPAISLAAGVPFIYDSAQPYANPFTENVDSVFLTAVPAGTLQIYALYDPTP